jgi:spore maturation protein CgeB
MLRTFMNRPNSTLQRPWHNATGAIERTTFTIQQNTGPDCNLSLGKRPRWFRIETAGLSQVTVRYSLFADAADHGAKAGVIWIRFLGRDGKRLSSATKLSSGAHGYYRYIIPDGSEQEAFSVETPEGCIELQLGFALWHSTTNSLAVGNSIHVNQSVALPVPLAKKQGVGTAQGRVPVAPGEDSEVSLTLEPKWIEISAQSHKHLEGSIRVTGNDSKTTKAGIIWVKFLNRTGHDISSKVQIPTGHRGDYYYITPGQNGEFAFRLHAPDDCSKIQLGFAAWKASASPTQIENSVAFRALPPSSTDGLNPGCGPLQQVGQTLLVDRHQLSSDALVPLNEASKWLRVSVQGNKQLQVTVTVDERTSHRTAKSALLLVDFRMANGNPTSSSSIKKSQIVGPYAYMDTTIVGSQTFDFTVPADAAELRLGVRSWDAPDGGVTMRNRVNVEAAGPQTQNSHAVKKPFDPVEVRPKALKSARELKVALICDEFTYNSFKYEFQPVIIEPGTWRQQMEDAQPDIFFCESAWSGVDSVSRPWKGRIYSSVNFSKENRTELLEILDWCRENNVPTVFWNKEDPTHYTDRVHDFVDTAIQFGHVFTTDRNCVDRYKEEYGHNSVHCLPFATQPRLFNPINSAERTDEVIFAGSWYANHEDRASEMNSIFRELLGAGMPVKIFDRFYGDDDPLHVFPEFLQEFTVPAVTHEELAAVYKSSRFGLNINTVTGSPTMFARRAFELMSSNTLVLSNDFAGAREFFGDTLVRVGEGQHELAQLTSERVDVLRDKALHNVLAHHCYSHRFQSILDAINFDYAAANNELTIVFPVSTREEAMRALTTFNGLVTVASRVVLLLTHDIKGTDVREFYTEFNRYGVAVVSAALATSQEVQPETVIRGSHFAVLHPSSAVKPQQLERAVLHTGYIDGPIIFGSENQYVFSTHHRLEDLIAPREYFSTVMSHIGAVVQGDFYHV